MDRTTCRHDAAHGPHRRENGRGRDRLERQRDSRIGVLARTSTSTAASTVLPQPHANDWSNILLNQIGARRNTGGPFIDADPAGLTSVVRAVVAGLRSRAIWARAIWAAGDLGPRAIWAAGTLGRGDLGRAIWAAGDLGRGRTWAAGDLGRGDLGRGDLGGGDLFVGNPDSPGGELDFETATDLAKTPPNEFTACVIGDACELYPRPAGCWPAGRHPTSEASPGTASIACPATRSCPGRHGSRWREASRKSCRGRTPWSTTQHSTAPTTPTSRSRHMPTGSRATRPISCSVTTPKGIVDRDGDVPRQRELHGVGADAVLGGRHARRAEPDGDTNLRWKHHPGDGDGDLHVRRQCPIRGQLGRGQLHDRAGDLDSDRVVPGERDLRRVGADALHGAGDRCGDGPGGRDRCRWFTRTTSMRAPRRRATRSRATPATRRAPTAPPSRSERPRRPRR